MNRNQIVCADVFDYTRSLPDASVNCVVTSPPYYALRDYRVDGQIGMEQTPAKYVAKLVALFREIRRVLRDDGTMWINLGDSFANDDKWGGATSGKHVNALHGDGIGRTKRTTGLPPKSLMGIPWRVAFGLQDDGWILRSDIVWHKSRPMPESVSDRPTKAHEYIFLITKQPRYWYDAEAIKEPTVNGDPAQPRGSKGAVSPNSGRRGKQAEVGKRTYDGFNERWDARTEPLTLRNRRSVWTVAPEPTLFEHYAAFPRKLVEPMIRAGCPHQVCAACGAPWVRKVEKKFRPQADVSTERVGHRGKMADENHWKGFPRGTNETKTLGFVPTCGCGAETRPGVVLDPFMGIGTVALVAREWGRDFIGCDLSPKYVEITNKRLDEPYTLPMLVTV